MSFVTDLFQPLDVRDCRFQRLTSSRGLDNELNQCASLRCPSPGSETPPAPCPTQLMVCGLTDEDFRSVTALTRSTRPQEPTQVLWPGIRCGARPQSLTLLCG